MFSAEVRHIFPVQSSEERCELQELEYLPMRLQHERPALSFPQRAVPGQIRSLKGRTR